MEKITNSSWFIRLLALFFALLLFATANSEKKGSVVPHSNTLEATAEDVPITLKYDESQYYVSGYEEATTVYLRSANKVLLDMESNPQTRNFSIVADLTKFQEGTYEIPLEIVRLNGAVEGKLKNESIHITIEKRQTLPYKVTSSLSESLLQDGYQYGNIGVQPETIDITSGEETLKNIAQVVAPIKDRTNISESFKERVEVIALDKDGNVLNVICVPSSVEVNVKVIAPSKFLPLSIKQKGTPPQGIERYDFVMEQEQVEIIGSKELISNITFLNVDVDISGVTERTTISSSIQIPAGTTVQPQAVKVTVIPILEKKDEKEVPPSSSSVSTGQSEKIEPQITSSTTQETIETTDEN